MRLLSFSVGSLSLASSTCQQRNQVLINFIVINVNSQVFMENVDLPMCFKVSIGNICIYTVFAVYICTTYFYVLLTSHVSVCNWWN